MKRDARGRFHSGRVCPNCLRGRTDICVPSAMRFDEVCYNAANDRAWLAKQGL